MAQLSNFSVAVVATDGFEETELTEPVRALREAGTQVEVISPKDGSIQAFRHFDRGRTVKVDRRLEDADPDRYDGLLLPGGALNADALRTLPKVQSFLRAFQSAGKPIAAICHAPWELISACLVQGRTLTSYHTIQDDVRNAGGCWLDQEVVQDGNWVTSRQPRDLPAFNKAMLNLFSRG